MYHSRVSLGHDGRTFGSPIYLDGMEGFRAPPTPRACAQLQEFTRPAVIPISPRGVPPGSASYPNRNLDKCDLEYANLQSGRVKRTKGAATLIAVAEIPAATR